MNHPQRHRDYPGKDYDSLATTHAFLRDTILTQTTTYSSPRLRFVGTPVSLAAPLYCICRRHQSGFGTEHLKNDIRECCYPGKRTRPDTARPVCLFRRTYQREKAVSVSQTFHFLHPAARASSRFFSCWRDRRRCTFCNVKTKQACVKAWLRQDLCTNRSHVVATL
jgi:hypothetical protein